MKFSVLMSVYKKDKPEFLKTALESIYEKQTRKPDEIVVVFDGKLTEELYEVLEQFKKGKENTVFYYPQEINQGLGQALRIGTEKCTGDYIFRMDSDDISVSERFEKQIAYVEANPQIDILGTDIAEFDVSPKNENMRLRICPQKHDDIIKMGKKRNPMNHVTVCIKKSALKKCGGYETMHLLEDYYLWLKMIACGCKLENMHEVLVYVRIGNGFMKRRGTKKQISGWYRLQQFMLKNNMINKKRAILNMINITAFVFVPDSIRGLLYKNFFRKNETGEVMGQGVNVKKSKLCQSCRTGMDLLELDRQEPMCPYIENHNGKSCAMYQSLEGKKCCRG